MFEMALQLFLGYRTTSKKKTHVHRHERPPVYARCDKKATKDIKRRMRSTLLKLPYSESLFFKLTFIAIANQTINPPSFIT